MPATVSPPETPNACQRRDIVLEAYSPLGTGRHLSDPAVTAVAARTGRTPAQVLLRWSVQRGIPVISKSVHRDRIEENLRILSISRATVPAAT